MYAFYLHADEDKDIVPSEVMEIDIKDEELSKTLNKELVTAVVYAQDEQIWFYCPNLTTLVSYLQGMHFAITELVNKDWKEHFNESI